MKCQYLDDNYTIKLKQSRHSLNRLYNMKLFCCCQMCVTCFRYSKIYLQHHLFHIIRILQQLKEIEKFDLPDKNQSLTAYMVYMDLCEGKLNLGLISIVKLIVRDPTKGGLNIETVFLLSCFNIRT